jgi:hypothetical protein
MIDLLNRITERTRVRRNESLIVAIKLIQKKLIDTVYKQAAV